MTQRTRPIIDGSEPVEDLYREAMAAADPPCPTCGHVEGGLQSFVLGGKWRVFWRGFFGFFWPPLLPPGAPHLFDRWRKR